MTLADDDGRRIRVAGLGTRLCSAISRLGASLLISLHVSVVVYGNLLMLIGVVVYLLLLHHFLSATVCCNTSDATSGNELLLIALLLLLSLCRVVTLVRLLFQVGYLLLQQIIVTL